jgi:hypothetical protein
VTELLVPQLRGDVLLALARTLEDEAREIGRARLRVNADPELARFRFVWDRIARYHESALLLLTPSAAELAAWTYPGDDAAADAAIEVVWRRGDQIRSRLGDRRRRK